MSREPSEQEPSVEEVRPGIWSIPVPLPGPMRYTVAYAVHTSDGLVLIDAGWDGEEQLLVLEQGIVYAGATIDQVVGIVFTHGHRDHYGLLRRLRGRTSAWSALHTADFANGYADSLAVDQAARIERTLREFGCDGVELEQIAASVPRVSSRSGYERPDRFLADGDILGGGELLAIHTPGHSRGHMCFVHAGASVVFTGDHVLSRTTPHVGAVAGSAESPLDDYLDSLHRLEPYGDLLALPAHEHRLPLGGRTRDLLDHHDERLSEVRAAVSSGAQTVRSVAEAMTWSSPWAEIGPRSKLLAMTEALAHLHVLQRRGQVERGYDPAPYLWQARQIYAVWPGPRAPQAA